MVVNISEAARMASKTRKTIYKHIKQGKLSTSRDSKGDRGIDLAELIRVYGSDVKQPSKHSKTKSIQGGYPSVCGSERLDLLLKKIEDLESKVTELNQTIISLNNRLEYKPNEMPVKKTNEVSSLIAKLKSKL